MRNPATFLLPFVLAGVLTGCTGVRQLAAYGQKPLPRLGHPLRVQQVVILDRRAEASDGEIRLPVFSVPGTCIKHVPALTAAHREVMETLIREHTTNRGRSVRGVVTVEEAYKEFSSNWATEKERGVARLHVAFYSLEGEQLVAERTSSGDFLVQSADATPRKLEEVYRLALRNVLYDCLRNIDGQSLE